MLIFRAHLFALALGAGAVWSLACSPQIVDAVDIEPNAGTGATGGSTGTGGTGATGGTTGEAGGGSRCPDGGDEDIDQDGDGEPDCTDQCPRDPNKVIPGLCGCNLADPGDLPVGSPNCFDLAELLAHRFTFDGPSGSLEVVDTVESNNGEVVRTSLSGDGTLALAGGTSEQYATLPPGLLSAHQSITIETWIRWDGGRAWQRIFDFGSNGAPAGEQAPSGTSYLFLTPRTPVDTVTPQLYQTGKLRLAYRRAAGQRELTVEAPIALPSGGDSPTHVAVVVDSENRKMSIYIDGALQLGKAFVALAGDIPPIDVSDAGPYDWGTPLEDGSMPPAVVLTDIDDVNNWLGRSQYQADDELSGTYYEFRIYSGALTDAQIAISHTAGPDPVFLPRLSSLGSP